MNVTARAVSEERVPRAGGGPAAHDVQRARVQQRAAANGRHDHRAAGEFTTVVHC